jgi:hypothetical protein
MIRWTWRSAGARAQVLVFRGSHVAVVDAATLDAEAVKEALRIQELLKTRLKDY